MFFLSPLWLALLVPWAGVVLWLLWRRGERTNVPFIDLWRSPGESPRAKRWVSPPPVALVAIIASMLLAIVASARPTVRAPARDRMMASDSGAAVAKPSSNVGITHLAAMERPHAQVMVTVRNDSALTHAELTIRAAETSQHQSIALPGRGAERNYFVDLAAAGDEIDASLDVVDDRPADNSASLKRQGARPKVEVRSDLPPEVGRVVEAYQRARPAGDGGRIVAVRSSSDAMSNEPGAIVAAGNAAAAPAGDLQIAAHPIVANVDFSQVKLRPMDQVPAGEGWTPVVSAGKRALVAARESPARQVWLGFDAKDFARTPGFVIFWANVLDWTGGGGDTTFVESITPSAHDALATADLSNKTPNLDPAPVTGKEIAPWLLLAAMGLLVLAAWLWPGQRLTAFSTPRTV